MPAEFRKLGIAFQYPDNWSLDESDAIKGRQSVTVYSPNGAFWSVGIHPRWAVPEQLASAAVEAMREEYKELEVDETTEELANQEISGFDISFYYLDLINTAAIRCVSTDEAVYTVFCQAEDREFDRLHLVFQAITVSLLNAIRGEHGIK
ncbi:MAG: hypothetical protein HUU20_11050 [Pirellulales bacterium]|nr:hypothetical protein [Pirellulales bacterium]